MNFLVVELQGRAVIFDLFRSTFTRKIQGNLLIFQNLVEILFNLLCQNHGHDFRVENLIVPSFSCLYIFTLLSSGCYDGKNLIHFQFNFFYYRFISGGSPLMYSPAPRGDCENCCQIREPKDIKFLLYTR